MCVLMCHIPKSLMSKMLTLACSMKNVSAKADALHWLLPKLKVIETDVTVWQEVLHGLSYRNRQDFLTDIPKLTPAIIALSGEDKTVLNLVVEAMRDVCLQWP